MDKRVNFLLSKRLGQLTLFVIVALVIIGAIGGYFLFKSKFIQTEIPANILPVYEQYKSCVENSAIIGAKEIGLQGGYIEKPAFEAGSEYSPFSNQLGFLGRGIPYWYYVSGNGIAKEQIPTNKEMGQDLGDFIKTDIANCDFGALRAQGYVINAGDSQATANIQDNVIQVFMKQTIDVTFGDSSFSISNRQFDVSSNLGKMYNSAKRIYDYESEKLFIENYARDVLYTYAPVEGVLLNCSPKMWNPYEVFDNLKLALESNMQAIKINGDYYTKTSSSTDYFITGTGMDFGLDNENVRLLYSRDWAGRFEVWPTNNNLMIASPVGNQPGLNAMGFCYIPYKFVYDMYFPVLIQITSSNGDEIFQFPISVVISKNAVRQSNATETLEPLDEMCTNANSDLTVYSYDTNLNPVEADVSFSCLTSSCQLGRTKIDNSSGDAVLRTKAPQCSNGWLSVRADGYKEKKYLISTNEESSADILLSKEKQLGVEIYVDGSLTDNLGVLSISEYLENTSNYVAGVSYPYTKILKLADGDYSFDLKIYNKNSMTIPEVTKQQCFTAPKDGILGFMGFEDEKCMDITIPSQTMSNLLYAGGVSNRYVSQSELENANLIRIYATSVSTPKSVEELQNSYEEIKLKSLDIEIA